MCVCRIGAELSWNSEYACPSIGDLSQPEDPAFYLPTRSTLPRSLHGDLVVCLSILHLVDGVGRLDVRRDVSCQSTVGRAQSQHKMQRALVLDVVTRQCSGVLVCLQIDVLTKISQDTICVPSGCCNPTMSLHMPSAFPRRSDVVGLEEYLPCLGSCCVQKRGRPVGIRTRTFFF